MIEYALLAAFIAVAIMSALVLVGLTLSEKLKEAAVFIGDPE